MEFSKEIGQGVILSVSNPQNAATIRVNVEKIELDDQNVVQPVKNKKISLNAVQYASLKEHHQAILDEIYFRQENPKKYGHEMKMHLGGTIFASMNRDYDLLSLRNHYFLDSGRTVERPRSLHLKTIAEQNIDAEEDMDVVDGDVDKTIKIEPSYDTCDCDGLDSVTKSEAQSKTGSKRKWNGEMASAKRNKTNALAHSPDASNFSTCESKDSRDKIKMKMFDKKSLFHKSTVPTWSVADAIPGVPGISLKFKTAECLFDCFDELDNMFQNLDEAMPCKHTDKRAELNCYMCTPVYF